MIFTCPKCGDNNLLRDEVNLYTNGGIICKKCQKKYNKEYRAKNKDKCKSYELKRYYGITIKEYNKLSESQLHGCAICKQPAVKDKLSVDHDHKTNEIRGLLCQNCNAALGMLKEDEDIIWNMLEYLKRTTWSKVA